MTTSINTNITDANNINPPRRYFSRQRRALSHSERQQAGKLASTHLIKLQSKLPSRAKVGVYLDAFGEMPTQPIVDWCVRLGYQAYLPVVGALGNANKRMQFAPIYHRKLSQVPSVRHRLGMKQPATRHLLTVDRLDVIFCPLVAADRQGNRMGMGGGYYDTTLASIHQYRRKKPLIIGWCYDFQVVDTLISQPWDVPLDTLITPSEFIVF